MNAFFGSSLFVVCVYADLFYFWSHIYQYTQHDIIVNIWVQCWTCNNGSLNVKYLVSWDRFLKQNVNGAIAHQ